MKKQIKVIAVAFTLAGGAFIGAAAYSPYLIYGKLNTSFEELDAKTFNSYMDYSSIRMSLRRDAITLLRREFKHEPEEVMAGIEEYVDNALSNVATIKSVEHHFETEHRLVSNKVIMLYPPSYFISREPIRQSYSGFPSVFEIVIKGRDDEPYEAIFFRTGFFEWKLQWFSPTKQNGKWYDADGHPIKY